MAASGRAGSVLLLSAFLVLAMVLILLARGPGNAHTRTHPVRHGDLDLESVYKAYAASSPAPTETPTEAMEEGGEDDAAATAPSGEKKELWVEDGDIVSKHACTCAHGEGERGRGTKQRQCGCVHCT